MLPGLEELLRQTPKRMHHGWVVNPLPLEYEMKAKAAWFKPAANDLTTLARRYNNSAIARACGVTETAVRKWLTDLGFQRGSEFHRHHGDVNANIFAQVRKRARRLFSHGTQRSDRRLTKERVSRISKVGQQANIVVQQSDGESGRRLTYASAHDLRRGCALRLINAGISAEILKVALRHQDIATTERFYGASRTAQSAATEIQKKLVSGRTETALVGGTDTAPGLSAEQLRKLKAFLNSL